MSRELLKEMTRDHCAAPDPVSWLAAADVLEERGDDLGARMWRRRAEWFPVLRRAIDGFVADPRRIGEEAVAVGPFTVLVGSNLWDATFRVAGALPSKLKGYATLAAPPASQNRALVRFIDRLMHAERLAE